MKTVYTDKSGLLPWSMLFVSAVMFFSAYNHFSEGETGPFGFGSRVGGVFFILGGCVFLTLSLKRFGNVRSARREGRDPTVVRVTESDR